MSRERSRSPRRGDALSWQPGARPVRQLYTVYSFQYLVIRPCPPPEDYDEYHVVNVQARGLLGPQGESFARREAEVYIRLHYGNGEDTRVVELRNEFFHQHEIDATAPVLSAWPDENEGQAPRQTW